MEKKQDCLEAKGKAEHSTLMIIVGLLVMGIPGVLFILAFLLPSLLGFILLGLWWIFGWIFIIVGIILLIIGIVAKVRVRSECGSF